MTYDRRHIEVYTRVLVGHQLGLAKIPEADAKLLRAWAADDADPTFARWIKDSSDNWGPEALAACVDDPLLRSVFRFWLAYQLGDLPAPDPSLALFGGSEQLSSDYEEKRLWAVATLRLYAKRNDYPARAEDLRLTGLYFSTVAALWALAAAPGPDRVVHKANHGGLFYGGPALPPVGGRGNHFGQVENEPAFCELLGIKADWIEDRYPDALPVLRLLEGDFGVPALIVDAYAVRSLEAAQVLVQFLAKIRLQERQHFARWADGSVACWVERQPSHLSPSYMAWVYEAARGSAEVGFPFQPDRKNRGKGNEYPTCTCQETDGYLVVQGGNAECSPLKLPAGDPVYHVVVGPDAAPALLAPSGATIPAPAPDAPPPPRKAKKPWWRF